MRMADVARIAGVTPTTVSRAMRNPGALSPATLERVRAAIRQTGFVPNLAARSLVSQRSQIIVALVPTIMNSVFSGAIETLSRELAAGDYTLLLGETGFDGAAEEELLRGFMGWRPAGLVLVGSAHTDGTRRILETASAAVVEIWNLPERPFDMAVGLDNRAAARAMTASLIEWGFRRIAFMNLHYPGNDRSVDRRDGWVDGLHSHGLEPLPELEARVPFGMEQAGLALMRLMQIRPRPDALFCASDTLAVGALMAATRAGIRVPEDLAIAGFGDVELASTVVPSLTTVHVSRARIGRESARLLLDRLEGRAEGPATVDCGFRIVRRESA